AGHRRRRGRLMPHASHPKSSRPALRRASTPSRKRFVQVVPVGIGGKKQAHLPGARPVLHRLLTLDSQSYVLMPFDEDEPLESVAFREAFDDAFAMLPGAP